MLPGVSRALFSSSVRLRFPRCISRRPLAVRQLSSSSPRLARYARFDPEHPLDMRRWDTGMKVVAGVIVGGGVYYVIHLEQVPETGRWRFMDINPKFEAKLAETAREELLAEFKGKTLPPNHPLTRHVRRVVTRILESSNLGTLSSPEHRIVSPEQVLEDLWEPQLRSESETPPGAGGRVWNLLVVNDDKIVNAMASYGSIVVFTGILPVARDEAGLAAILGHEIGHVVARHASERYSEAKVFIFLAYLLELTGLDFGFARMLTTLLYSLPNSRTQEFEADKIGLTLSSKACYDPRSAPEMFARLGKLDEGYLNISFLNTHPTSDKRIKQLEDMLPEAYALQAATPECGDSLRDSLGAFRDTFARGFNKDNESASWRWG
ncbi:Mitochondrial metalloendopeptidase OMA1 [Sparassis crispa]|uniref:Mitochondrial metalloendopeptidase OMA1 n=1 Tax=Sparassis crispa TaxID=139825 RepID=A0A401GTU0_9APHY|nr:Mitochondrial metalloendopeptidase OMA1 [Sparassis crispa]GBE85642.1 Mitochondrial metalloendopeptidase OMA1 [Sparassis crispa]